MKILFDPIYTLLDTEKCVTQFHMDETARYFLNKYPDSYVYYITPPKNCKLCIFSYSLKKDYPDRVMYFEGQYILHDRIYEYIWRPEWFSNIVSGTGYAYDWDILVSTRGAAMNHIRHLNNYGKMSKCKKIILYDSFPLLKFKKSSGSSRFQNFEELELTTLASYIVTDKIMVGTEYEIKKIINTGRKYLSPTMVRKLKDKLENAWMVPRGLDLNYPLTKVPKKKGDKMIGIFTQRMSKGAKRPEKVLDSFFYSFVTEPPGSIEFKISTNSAKSLPQEDGKKWDFIDFYSSTRDKFYELLRGCDFCISFSIMEGMPSSIVEAICQGCIPVLNRKDWSEDLVGKEYPFLFDSLAEAVLYIKRIQNEPERTYEIFKEWYKTFFLDYLKKGERCYIILDELVETQEKEAERLAVSRDKQEIEELIIDLVRKEGRKSFILHEILTEMYDRKITRVDPRQANIPFTTQHELSKKSISIRYPRYYNLLKSLMVHTGWANGLEVGEVVVR